MARYNDVAVVGAGAWGTALAVTLARAGSNVKIWALEPEVVEEINLQHENVTFLAGCPIPETVSATSNFSDIVENELIFIVTPSQFLRKTLSGLSEAGLPETVPLVLCSKGVEQGSLELMNDVASSVVKNPIAVLSGPTFADEVAQGLPAAATLACQDDACLQKIKNTVDGPSFSTYVTHDVIGTEISGAVKNVLAIACGIASGRGLGKNAEAAVITGGMIEIRRLCITLGGKSETLMGLCGFGDVILTCSSRKSRNMSLGYALGSGEVLEDYLKGRKTVAEGYFSAKSVYELAKKHGVRMPICGVVHDILYEGLSIDDGINKVRLEA